MKVGQARRVGIAWVVILGLGYAGCARGRDGGDAERVTPELARRTPRISGPGGAGVEAGPESEGHGPAGVSAESPTSAAVRDGARAVVAITAVDGRAAAARPRALGSGVIASSDGAILTSLHVLYDETRHELHDRFTVSVATDFGREPIPLCTGETRAGAFDEGLDLALVRCDSDLDGAPLGRRTWAFIGLDDGAEAGDVSIHVAGFTSGRERVLVWSRGSISVAGGAARVSTAARVIPGMSGGPVIADDGRLLGLATAYRYRMERSADEPTQVAVTHLGRVQLLAPARTWLDEYLAKGSATSR